MLTRRGFGAITFGHVIVSATEPSNTVWRHELRHVAQYERLGLAFLPLYLWYRARYGYVDHPLERGRQVHRDEPSDERFTREEGDRQPWASLRPHGRRLI